jgi:plastocyanin
MEVFMHRICERLTYAAPLIFALAGACSSDDTNPAQGGSGGAGTTPIDAAVGFDAAPTPDSAPAGVVMVQMVAPMSYSPKVVTVAHGTTVMWMNVDTIAHTSTSTTGLWDSGPVAPGASFSRQFNDVGTFPYFCTIHGMIQSGTVNVQ